MASVLAARAPTSPISYATASRSVGVISKRVLATRRDSRPVSFLRGLEITSRRKISPAIGKHQPQPLHQKSRNPGHRHVQGRRCEVIFHYYYCCWRNFCTTTRERDDVRARAGFAKKNPMRLPRAVKTHRACTIHTSRVRNVREKHLLCHGKDKKSWTKKESDGPDGKTVLVTDHLPSRCQCRRVLRGKLLPLVNPFTRMAEWSNLHFTIV